MDDETHCSLPNVPNTNTSSSPDTPPCFKNNSTTTTTITATTTTTPNTNTNNNNSTSTSTTTNNNSSNNNNNGSSHNHHNKEQDRFLPIANVGRIMKKVIPGNGKISKDAKETVQECVSEFISFVTGEASDKCQREKRKTINGDDIIWAITTLGFEDYVAPLKTYLNKYREIEEEKINNVPKQQQQRTGAEQRVQTNEAPMPPPQDHSGNLGPFSNLYSSSSPANFLPHHHHHHHHQGPFMGGPGPDQGFGLPFAGPSPIPKQMQQQDQIDSGGGHW